VRQCFFNSHLSQFSSCESCWESCAISNLCRIPRARANLFFTCPICCGLHDCSTLANRLSFIEIRSSGHDEATTSWKPSSLVQKHSKWNLFFPTDPSFKPSNKGQWSDISLINWIFYTRALFFLFNDQVHYGRLLNLLMILAGGLLCLSSRKHETFYDLRWIDNSCNIWEEVQMLLLKHVAQSFCYEYNLLMSNAINSLGTSVFLGPF
jgi:hypothetical protein